jgi:NAD(P)-dependent dehydrogenase (short-subunit alcohol dehydrogenase family)
MARRRGGLAGKVALVTGAGSGIGRATAQRLAQEGASVVVDDIDEDGGRETVRLIEACRGNAAFVRADVALETSVRTMTGFAEETFGGLDVLVNNAGVYISPPYFPEADVSRWSRVLDVYLRGVMLCMHYAVRAMERRGGGAIVNIASGAGVGYRPHDAPEYAAAKAGVVRLTASLATLAERRNIRVNCICPGWVNTPASQRTLAGMSAAECASQAPASMREPEEIADAVVELLRDDGPAGRVMLYYEGQDRRLVPAGAEV